MVKMKFNSLRCRGADFVCSSLLAAVYFVHDFRHSIDCLHSTNTQLVRSQLGALYFLEIHSWTAYILLVNLTAQAECPCIIL